MLSRRVFLLSAFVVPGLSVFQRAAMGLELQTAKVLVLCENNCADTKAFSSCLPATQIESDPGSILQELDSSFRQGEYDLVFGLSRDSNYVLVEQYAQASAYYLGFQGLHKYETRGMSHSLAGNKDVITSLSAQLNSDIEHWTRIISRVPGFSDYQDQQMHSEVLNTTHSCPAQGPGQLVSWLFRRKQA
jgi:hypothetical protein